MVIIGQPAKITPMFRLRPKCIKSLGVVSLLTRVFPSMRRAISAECRLDCAEMRAKCPSLWEILQQCVELPPDLVESGLGTVGITTKIKAE